MSGDFCSEIIYLDEIDSTNAYLKRIAASGAPHGTVVIAEGQTSGRGRMGRGFVSEAGKGLYLSLLLRPDAGLTRSITMLTAFAAVAVCEAIMAIAPLQPKIKWVNDILVDDRKLCGILSEMSIETAQVDYVVIGVGINVHYEAADFPEELRDKAISLDMLTDEPLSRAKLAAALIDAFARMVEVCSADAQRYIDRYRERSITVGREILVLRGEEQREAEAIGISSDCGLIVRYPDGAEETLHYGETSIRGVRGYI